MAVLRTSCEHLLERRRIAAQAGAEQELHAIDEELGASFAALAIAERMVADEVLFAVDWEDDDDVHDRVTAIAPYAPKQGDEP